MFRPAGSPFALVALGAPARTASARPAGVGWPASTGTGVGEVVTRGASRVGPVRRAVQRVAGSHGPRRAGARLRDRFRRDDDGQAERGRDWHARPVRHLLLANAAGDLRRRGRRTFSGGFSTAGGTLVLRNSRAASVVDALSWGSAASAFVEGDPAASRRRPAAASSGCPAPGSNWLDTNDNALTPPCSRPPWPRTCRRPPAGTGPLRRRQHRGQLRTLRPVPTASPVPASPSPATTAPPSPRRRPQLARRSHRSGAGIHRSGHGSPIVRGRCHRRVPARSSATHPRRWRTTAAASTLKLPAMPSGDLAAATLCVAGMLAAPYGNLEVRPPMPDVSLVGHVAVRRAVGHLRPPRWARLTKASLCASRATVASIATGSSGSADVDPGRRVRRGADLLSRHARR